MSILPIAIGAGIAMSVALKNNGIGIAIGSSVFLTMTFFAKRKA
jgi:hypothetical protein